MNQLTTLSEEAKDAFKQMMGEIFVSDVISRIEKMEKTVESTKSAMESELLNVISRIEKMEKTIESTKSAMESELSKIGKNIRNGILIYVKTNLTTMKRSKIKDYFYDDMPIFLKLINLNIEKTDLDKIWGTAKIRASKLGLIVSYKIFLKELIFELNSLFSKDEIKNQ